MPQQKNFPHDAAHKAIFGYREMIESLLMDFVPEDFIREFDFSTLEPCDTSFVTKNFTSRLNDMVWRVRWRDTECYICVLIEFQSSHDEKMAIRILEYSSLLLNSFIKKQLIKSGGKLPAIFPIVLYNGDAPWTAPLDVIDLICLPDKRLKEYQPRQRYFVIDEKHIPKEAVQKARGTCKVYIAN